MNKKVFLLLSALVLGALALAACAVPAGSPVVQTDSKDYVASMLAYREVGDSVGGMAVMGVIALVVGIVLGAVVFFAQDENRRSLMLPVAAFVLGVTLAFGLGAVKASYVTVDAGDTGVLIDQGSYVETLNPGQHWIRPWFQKVVLFTTRTFTFTTLSDPIGKGSEQYRTYSMDVTSSDIVKGTVSFNVQASVNPAKAGALYKKYGTLENAIVQTIKTPSLGFVRDAMRGKSAEQIITQIETLNSVIEKQLIENAQPNGIVIESFAFRRPDFGEYEKMRDATAVSLQAAEKAKNDANVIKEQQQARLYQADTDSKINQVNAEAQAKSSITKAEADAKIAATAAQGNADALKIQAEAQANATVTKAAAEAKGNKDVAASITPTLIDYLKWQRWDGKMPQIVSDLANLFITNPVPATK